jgi:CAAX protease family protein
MPDQLDVAGSTDTFSPPTLPPAPPPSPAPLSPWVTALCGIFAGGYLVFAFVTASPSPLDRLEFPEESLERLVTREMDLRDALYRAPEWKRALYTAFAGGDDPLAEAVEWYDELVTIGTSPQAQLYRVVLLAEAGQIDRVGVAVVPWEFQGESAFRMAQWVRAAYLGVELDPATARGALSQIRTELPPGWFSDVLAARVAARLGDRAVQQEAQSAIGARGEQFLDRWIVLILAQVLLLCLGIAMLGRFLSLRTAAVGVGEASAGPLSTMVGVGGASAGSPPTMVADAPLPPPWPSADGYGLFLRGVFGFLLMGLLAYSVLPKASPYNGIATLAAGIPLLWWLSRYLSAQGLSVAAAFGLRLPPGGAGRLASVTLAVIGLSVIGEVIITFAGDALHIKPHWADGLLEGMLWGPWWLVACETLDSVVWAPLIEELAFRGVLYGTLRMTIGVWPAVGISAAFFALVHGYGTIGFASVLWSGILWALAYERSRSLLPAILAHMFNNLLVTAEFIWLLRM